MSLGTFWKKPDFFDFKLYQLSTMKYLSNFIILNIIFIIKLNAQNVDLSSVDEFFAVADSIKKEKLVSEIQWTKFDNSRAYKRYAQNENKFLINTIKNAMYLAFEPKLKTQKDSILSISYEDANNNKALFLKKFILLNYIDLEQNFDAVQKFRTTYKFDKIIEQAKERLSEFLECPLDTSIKFQSIYFFFVNADGAAKDDGIYIDFNLFYKMTDQQRINFVAHEFFHTYRSHFENPKFKINDINSSFDLLQNEGIADQIDKFDGFNTYYSSVLNDADLAQIMEKLYNSAENDLKDFQTIILKYSTGELSETTAVDQILLLFKYNAHPLASYMSTQIVTSGFKTEMVRTFYKPYEFFQLYNNTAKLTGAFQFNDEFINYLMLITKAYY